MPKIMIGTPNFAAQFHCNVTGYFMQCFKEWSFKYGQDNVNWRIVPRRFAHMARNDIAREFLDSGFDYLFWIDDDAIVNPEILYKMLAHMDAPEVGVVIAPYMMRRPPYGIGVLTCDGKDISNTNNYRNLTLDELNQGLIEVDGGGTHCMLVKREMFEKVNEPWFRLPPLGGTEDMYFCLKVRKLGLKIHCDTDLEIPHIGEPQIITRRHTEAWAQVQGNKSIDEAVTEDDVKRGYISIDAVFADGSEHKYGSTGISDSAAHKEDLKEQAR